MLKSLFAAAMSTLLTPTPGHLTVLFLKLPAYDTKPLGMETEPKTLKNSHLSLRCRTGLIFKL